MIDQNEIVGAWVEQLIAFVSIWLSIEGNETIGELAEAADFLRASIVAGRI